jgi:hypothetical protein
MAWWPMMRGVRVELPPTAQVKLAKLDVSRMVAEDATRAAQSRLSGLGRDADPGVITQLTRERDRHAERHRSISALIHKINQWLMELRLPPGAVLEAAPQIAIEVKNGQTLSAAIETARNEIKSLQQKLAAARSAPLPQADQIRAAEAYVAKMASTAKPTVAVMRDDQIRVTFRDSVVGGTDDVLALACWLQPEAVVAALTRDIEQMPTPINPLTRAERLQKVSELEGQLLELGFLEDGLILRAAQDGIDVMRRRDADPRCVLGVVIKAKTAQVPAAQVVA